MEHIIDTELLRREIEKNKNMIDGLFTEGDNSVYDGEDYAYNIVLRIIDSLQQEPTPDTDVLHTELVNLLKTYRIGEETARTMADRIADTYGAQRYMDGLCDGLDEEDTKQEQPEVELEKEMDRFFEEMPVLEHENIFEDTYQMIARHFFELGLKAGKGE